MQPPTYGMEYVLHNLVGTRYQFFRRWHHENSVAHYLRNESRMLELIDYFTLRGAMQRLNLNATVQIPLNVPPNAFMDPVVVAPTPAQMEAAFQVPDQPPEGACPICQEAYTPNSVVVRLRGCQHCFHRQCATAWYTMSVRCPLCRHDIREAHNNNG